MNSYLINTALLAVGLDTPIMSNAVNTAILKTQHTHENILEASLRLEASKDFANGDFTSISRSVKLGALYTGDGSREMYSARVFRF